MKTARIVAVGGWIGAGRLGLAGGGGGESWMREAGTGSVGCGGRSSMRVPADSTNGGVGWGGSPWFLGWGSGWRRDEGEDAGGEENR
jgi:hypothetical protein